MIMEWSRRIKIVARWSALAVIAMTAFLGISYWMTESFPVTTSPSEILNISRWWDVLLAPIYVCALTLLISRDVKKKKEFSLRNILLTWLAAGIMLGILLGLLNGMFWGMVTGLYLSAFAGLVIAAMIVVFCLFFKLNLLAKEQKPKSGTA